MELWTPLKLMQGVAHGFFLSEVADCHRMQQVASLHLIQLFDPCRLSESKGHLRTIRKADWGFFALIEHTPRKRSDLHEICSFCATTAMRHPVLLRL